MNKQLSYTLFTEKYRPSKVSEVLMPNEYRTFFNQLIKEGEIKNLLLYSSIPGAGKTSLAKALCSDIGADYMYINMSEESGIDVLRTDMRRFASGKSLNKKKKIIIIDECDGANIHVQKALRVFIEEFHNNCRFIGSCNYVNKIIPALRSRFQEFDFNMNTLKVRNEMLPKVLSRISGVLKFEKIEYSPEVLKQLIDDYYPDIRKVYQLLQQYHLMYGIIDQNIFNFSSIDNKFYEMILNKQFTSARQFVLDSGYDLETMYTDLYKNLIPLISNKAVQCEVILCIAEWQYRSSLCSDKEIPFSAMLVDIISKL